MSDGRRIGADHVGNPDDLRLAQVQPPKVEGQGPGPAGALNPMRTSEESTEQRLARWRKLRAHLRDYGLRRRPPNDLLLKAEPTTRPEIPLVAYYDEIEQESLGNNTVVTLISVVLAVVVPVLSFAEVLDEPVLRVIEALMRWGLKGFLNDVWQRLSQTLPMGIINVALNALVLAVAAVVYTLAALLLWAVLKNLLEHLIGLMVARRGSLTLTPEELSLALPDRHRHARWRDVYVPSVDHRRKWGRRRWPWLGKEPCVRVELNDGVVVWLYVCADECEPLADLMRDFVVHHRGDHTAASATAS